MFDLVLKSTWESWREQISFVKLPLLSLSASVIMSTNTDPSELTEPEAEWEKTHHVFARQLSYPGSTAIRFPVPEEKVPWEVAEHKFTCMTTSLSI